MQAIERLRQRPALPQAGGPQAVESPAPDQHASLRVGPFSLEVPVPTWHGGKLPLTLDLDDQGRVVAHGKVLGFVPVAYKIDLERVARGDYGTQLDVDLSDPAHTQVSGDLRLPDLPVSMPDLELGPTQLSRVFQQMHFDLSEPGTLRFDGALRMGQSGVPVATSLVEHRTGPTDYDLDVKGTTLGASGLAIPDTLAALGAWIYLSWVKGLKGFSWAGGSRLHLDLAAAMSASRQLSNGSA